MLAQHWQGSAFIETRLSATEQQFCMQRAKQRPTKSWRRRERWSGCWHRRKRSWGKIWKIQMETQCRWQRWRKWKSINKLCFLFYFGSVKQKILLFLSVVEYTFFSLLHLFLNFYLNSTQIFNLHIHFIFLHFVNRKKSMLWKLRLQWWGRL